MKTISRSKIIYHIIFWVVAFTLWLFTMFVASNFKNILQFEPVFMTLVFNCCFAAAVYLNLFVLKPLLFRKRRFFSYILSIIGAVSVTGIVIDFLLVYPLNSFVDGEKIFQEMSFMAWFNFAFFALVYVGVTTFLSLMREWFVLQQVNEKFNDVEREKLEAELKALKTQINPHFLFNTLNNLYSLTLDKSDKASDLVLRLSDLMRYILYECNDRFVSIAKELDFIHNYLELQKIRLGDTVKVRMEITGQVGEYKIAPLLFEPIIENAFKHGSLARNNDGFVNILFNFEKKGELELIVENRYNKEWPINEENDKGIGVSNVIRRLELLYPDRHQFKVDEFGDLYRVIMSIKIS